MASPGDRRCANCIGTLLLHSCSAADVVAAFQYYKSPYQTSLYYQQLFLSGLFCVCTFYLELYLHTFVLSMPYHSASPVLTATGFVNGRGQFSTPTESTPLDRSPKNLLLVITSTTPTAVPNLVQIRPRGASGQMGEM